MKTAKLTMALAVCAALLATVGAGSASAEWGIKSFQATYQDPSGAVVSQAGAHADSFTYPIFNQVDGEEIRDAVVDLPAGFYGNPQAAPTCTIEALVRGEGYCKPAAQVGVYEYEVAPNFFIDFPVYNMETPSSKTAVLGVVLLGALTRINVSVRTDGDYGLTATLPNINQAVYVDSAKITLWGVPADPVHDAKRFVAFGFGGFPAGVPPKPFLSMPARCDTPMTTTITADTWQHPGARNLDGSYDFSDPNWFTAGHTTSRLTGCENLDFSPTLKARPTTNVADSPSGLDVDLKVPQDVDNPDGLSSANLKTAVVTLPEGLVINPSGANGLEGCSPSQIGLTTQVGSGKAAFTKAPPACPDASKIGETEVDLPVFPDSLKGSVYAALPEQNPFGNLLTIYLSFEGHGIVSKLAGKVTPDPNTGRLTATFEENPQVAFEDFKLRFFGGAAGVLRTPATCGNYSTTSTLTPWSAPETPTRFPQDKYAISQGANGQSCATSEAQLPNKPSFQGGSVSPIAGAYKPFVVNLRREDGSQQFRAVTLTPPPGLVARLAGTPPCPEALLELAEEKSGTQEKARPSCPATSAVGNVYAAAGAGPAPYNAPGKVYLAGPYKGAPLSLATVIPATAGPYDLGTVVTRVAVHVDPITAQVTAISDPIPTILEGIPLDVRSVSLRLDKPDFSLNPTSCDPSSVTGTLFSTTGAGAALNNRFQVAECGRLKFGPKLSISLKGKTKRTGNPALTAVLTMPEGQANIRKTTVMLPATEFIDNAHINNPCTRVQFNADACPASSILGTARAFTPLLDEPLEGPVYFRSNGGERELPDMVVDLDGQIHVTLVGFIDSVPVKGTESTRVRTRFVNVPDAPVSKFVLKLFGGKRGLIENSVNLCKAKVGPVSVQMEAQNAKTAFSDQPLGTSCGGKKAAKRKR